MERNLELLEYDLILILGLIRDRHPDPESAIRTALELTREVRSEKPELTLVWDSSIDSD